jgi:eukaryotic-like serine/threonine-protein kinase
MVGRRVGAYEVVAKLGEGGMGEVYRARDARLKRDVALKVLPASVAADAHRLARFEREAQVLAALNHSNIGAIYGIEEGALVLELVDGPTLADLIAAGPLPLREALPIARQICDALDAAHEQGIIHRDLKPANIKVRPDGSVKVLDFGLAKAVEALPAETTASTLTSPAVVSTVGVILGTAAYMSPEQARGKPVDKRSDVWAFGCVLYEMLAGIRAFEGDSVTDTLSRVLQLEPDFSLLPPATPQAIRRLLMRCLEKDRNRRLPQIAAAAFQLDEALAAGSSSSAIDVRPGAAERPRRLPMLALAIIVSAIGGAAITWLVLSRAPAAILPVTRLQVNVSPAAQLGGAEGRPTRAAFDIAPDGRTIVFSAVQNNQRGLFLRPLDQAAATLMPGTDGAVNPFFSPDGQWVAYFGRNQIRKVPITGGPPVTVTPAMRLMFGASWGDDDVIVFARSAGGLWEVPAAGGTPVERTLIDREKGEVSHRLPHVLPGGDAVLYTVLHNRFPSWNETQVWVHSRRSKTSKLLIEGGADARYVGSGHLLYANEGALLAMPFDLDRLEVTGGAVGISDVMQAAYMPGQQNDSGAMQANVSRTGTLVYLAGGVQKPSEHAVVRVDRSGRPDNLSIAVQTLRTLRLSPDGSFLALGAVGRDRGISIYDLTRGSLTKLIAAGRGIAPVWTPDGERLTYAVAAKGPDNVFSVRADGGGAPESIVKHTSNLVPATWTADGRRLLFYVLPSEFTPTALGPPIVHVQDVVEKGEPTPVGQGSLFGGGADLSPDGRWLAYDSAEAGPRHVYVVAFPGPGPRFQVSAEGGGGSPVWRGDGRELFYVRASDAGQTMEAGDVELTIMSTTVAATPKMSFSPPRALFSGRYGVNGPARAYDVTKDGQHFFLMQLRKRPPDVITELSVVQNWMEELKRQK